MPANHQTFSATISCQIQVTPRIIIVIRVSYLSCWLEFILAADSAGFGGRSLAVGGAVAWRPHRRFLTAQSALLPCYQARDSISDRIVIAR